MAKRPPRPPHPSLPPLERQVRLLEAALLDVLEYATKESEKLEGWRLLKSRALCALDQLDEREELREESCYCGFCPPEAEEAPGG